MPGARRPLAEDLLRFLFAYYDRMPSQAFTYNLLGLINFELFSFTFKLVNAVNALVADPTYCPLPCKRTSCLRRRRSISTSPGCGLA